MQMCQVKVYQATLEAVGELLGYKYNRLSCHSTVDNICKRRLAVSHKQLESMVEDDNLTLYMDETSKHGQKYMVYGVTGPSQVPHVLGLKLIPSKSAKDTLNTLEETLTEIGTTIHNPNYGEEFVVKLQNTMSDRAATEVKFNSLLEGYKVKVIEELEHKLGCLSEEQKGKMLEINHFFCGLHLLVSLAETFSTALKAYEKENKELGCVGALNVKECAGFVKSTEAAPIRYVRTAAQLFARGADEKSGCFSQFNVYLQQQNEANLLVPFRHNRFNIIFHDGAAVYHLNSHITNFLEKVHGTTNSLMKAVLADSCELYCVAGARVLGSLCMFITSPLWRIIEDKSLHIGDMGPIYTELVDFLKCCASSKGAAASLLCGENLPDIISSYVKRDHVANHLVLPDPTDELATDILKYVCVKLADKLSSLVSDHLPEGKHHNMSNEERGKTGPQ